MTFFSSLLRQYVKESGFTNAYFAKVCDLDRTLLQKYLSGKRIPNNEQIVERMSRKLHLNPTEHKKLLEEYQRVIHGEEVYEQRRAVKELINQFRHFSTKHISLKKDVLEAELKGATECRLLQSRQGLYACLRKLLQGSGQSVDVRMICQPETVEFMELLGCLSDGRKVTMHHILSLDRGQSHESLLYNLQILNRSFPLLSSEISYEMRFYYGDLKRHVGVLELLSGLLFTEEGAILFDSGLTWGIWLDRGNIGFIMEQYKKIENKTRRLLTVQRIPETELNEDLPDPDVSLIQCYNNDKIQLNIYEDGIRQVVIDYLKMEQEAD